ncbi:hypothetical protein ABTJ81_19980, partial [Acinetobacter baumannii]
LFGRDGVNFVRIETAHASLRGVVWLYFAEFLAVLEADSSLSEYLASGRNLDSATVNFVAPLTRPQV